MTQRIVEIVEMSPRGLSNSYKRKAFARKCLRVVECQEGQRGLISEKGTTIIWESPHYDSRSRGPKSKYAAYMSTAEGLAAKARMAIAVGLQHDSPAEMVHDLTEELAKPEGNTDDQ